MLTLLLGQDTNAKETHISEFRKKLFKDPDALQFDYEVLYGAQLSAEELKKAFVALPILSKQRLIVIRECHRLNPRCQDLILAAANTSGSYELILESDKLEMKDSFVVRLGKPVKIVQTAKKQTLNVFKLGDMISERKSPEAVRMLSQLLLQGDQPLQIMGGLVWYWKNARNALGTKEFMKGLEALQEADLNIKRSRLKPEHALEVLVIKLCS